MSLRQFVLIQGQTLLDVSFLLPYLGEKQWLEWVKDRKNIIPCLQNKDFQIRGLGNKIIYRLSRPKMCASIVRKRKSLRKLN